MKCQVHVPCLYAETRVKKPTSSEGIQSITVEGIVMLQQADDTALFLNDTESLVNALSLITLPLAVSLQC